MAAAEVAQPPADLKAEETAPALPDYVTDPNAVLKDVDAKWRFGRAPDYSKTRRVFAETKKANHESGSLQEIVQNLVKNWEIEASFKMDLADWRTIDRENYSFAINGGPPQTGEHMLKVGTYNAIIAPNEYYSPNTSNFESSHKTFKRMMPTFAWEVLEVYSGPPHVSFRWRHWGTFKNDYVGFNDKSEKVTVKNHGGVIDIEGVTTATVNDKLQLQKVHTWFDPMEMFRQMAPQGIVNKVAMTGPVSEETGEETIENEKAHPVQEVQSGAKEPSLCPVVHVPASMADKIPNPHTAKAEPVTAAITNLEAALASLKALNIQQPNGDAKQSSDETVKNGVAQQSNDGAVKESEVKQSSSEPFKNESAPAAKQSIYSSSVTGKEEVNAEQVAAEASKPQEDMVDQFHDAPSEQVHPFPKDVEDSVKPAAGEAVIAAPDSEEAKKTYEELSTFGAAEKPFLLNRE